MHEVIISRPYGMYERKKYAIDAYLMLLSLMLLLCEREMRHRCVDVGRAAALLLLPLLPPQLLLSLSSSLLLWSVLYDDRECGEDLAARHVAQLKCAVQRAARQRARGSAQSPADAPLCD